MEEGLTGEMEDPFEAVKWQQVLGGEGFLRKLKDQWNQRVERPKNYGQKRNWSKLKLAWAIFGGQRFGLVLCSALR